MNWKKNHSIYFLNSHPIRGKYKVGEEAGKQRSIHKDFKFWKQDYYPIELDTRDTVQQRFNYLYEHLVRSGLVWETWHYKYSSTIHYYTNENGLVSIEYL